MPTLSAAKSPVTLKGREYRMSPLRDVDFDEVDIWIRSEVLKAAKATGDNEIIDRAILASAGIHWRSEAGQSILKQQVGMAKLLYLSLLPTHPKVTMEICRDWVNDAESIDNFLTVFAQLNFDVDVEDDDDSAESDEDTGKN